MSDSETTTTQSVSPPTSPSASDTESEYEPIQKRQKLTLEGGGKGEESYSPDPVTCALLAHLGFVFTNGAWVPIRFTEEQIDTILDEEFTSGRLPFDFKSHSAELQQAIKGMLTLDPHAEDAEEQIEQLSVKAGYRSA